MDKKSAKLFGVFGVSLLVIFVVFGTIKSKCSSEESKAPEDTNVYLGEEVVFGQDYPIKIVGMSVEKIEEQKDIQDEDGDILSPYILNLKINIKQVSNKKCGDVKFKSEMFTLKNVNIKSKSKMAIFFETLFKTTFEMSLSMAVDGEINIIDTTIGFAQDYLTEVSENIITETKFKPIKASKKQFEEFTFSKIGEEKEVSISFPIKHEYLESENTIVLTIDTLDCLERRIFLIQRPNTSTEN